VDCLNISYLLRKHHCILDSCGKITVFFFTLLCEAVCFGSACVEHSMFVLVDNSWEWLDFDTWILLDMDVHLL